MLATVTHTLNVADALNLKAVGHVVGDLIPSRAFERVHIGSNFCAQYLLAQPMQVYTDVLEACVCGGLPVTLAVPLATESRLDAVAERIGTLLEAGERIGAAHGLPSPIDELTCNDYASLMRFGTVCPQVRIIAGRLLSRDAREPREPYFDRLVWEPAILGQGAGNAFPGCRVDGFEFDPTHRVLDLGRVPSGSVCSLYADLCYLSTGMICESASLGVSIERKFRPGAACACPCLDYAVEQRAEGPRGIQAPSAPFVTFKQGKTTYYRQPGALCVGVGSYRLVHSVLLEEACSLR